MSDTDILAELRGHLYRAQEWAHGNELEKDDDGWSCIGSTLAAVEEGNVRLALTRWDDLLGTNRPQLSLEAEQWVAQIVKKRKAARLAFFCADLGLIDCPGGGEWADRAWSVDGVLDAAKSGAEEADALTETELDELFP